MGVFRRSQKEDYPVRPFTYIMSPDLLDKLLAAHMAAVKFEIQVSCVEVKDRVGKGIDGEIFHKAVAREK